METLVSKNKVILLCCCVFTVIFLTVFSCIAIVIHEETKTVSNMNIVVDLKKCDIGTRTPTGSNIMTKDEFENYVSSTNTEYFSTYEEYVTVATAEVVEIPNTIITGANGELYNIASDNFNVYYKDNRVSPLLIMSIANVETPGRADNSITWSALFPSRIVPVDKMSTFCVTDVISDPAIFKALSAEYSTRDRGALQMSPTYGTNNKAVNSTMSGTEKQKLSTVNTAGYESWVGGASDAPGDRFYLPDVCKRMQASMQGQIDNMLRNNYIPETDMQLIAQCAMGHHSSGVWYHKDRNKKVGCWHSGELAYAFSKKVGSQSFVNVLVEYANTHNDLYITSNVAKDLYITHYNESLSIYSTKDIVCTYPIKALYAYIKLCSLYSS